MPPRLFWRPLRRYAGSLRLRRPFHRTHMTEDQIKTAELQKSPTTPNQIATEVPHAKDSSLIYDVPSPGWYYRIGPVKDFFGWFSRMQRRRPLGLAIGTSLTTYFVGDVLAQQIGGEGYDPTRTLRMLSIGAVAAVPGYKWFLFLGSHFNYGSTLMTITIKVLIQQFFFAPLFNTYFFGMQSLLAGQSASDIKQKIIQTVPESIWSSAKFWPAVTALNFTVIPAHLRFAFSGVFAVVWQTYMSFLNRRHETHEETVTVTEMMGEAVEVVQEALTEDAEPEDEAQESSDSSKSSKA